MGRRLLLDTHAILWMALEPDKLSPDAVTALEDGENELFFSPVTAMEIATKVRLGKLECGRPLANGFAAQMIEHGAFELQLNTYHAELAGSFVADNQDPWDRLLAAQAKVEKMVLVTADQNMHEFDVEIFW